MMRFSFSIEVYYYGNEIYHVRKENLIHQSLFITVIAIVLIFAAT